MLSDQIRTISDLEKLYYTPAGVRYLNASDLTAPMEIMKTAGTITTSVSGYYNAIYGKYAWANLNMEANLYGALPKSVWGRSGARIITARANTLPTAGVAQDGSLPSAVYPTVETFSYTPKTAAGQVFEVTEIHNELGAGGQNDTYMTMADSRDYYGNEHLEDINVMLNTQNGTLASNKFEPIDRVVASYSEITNCTDSANAIYTAGDLDIYGLDRDSVTTYDGYVDHNSGTDRAVTDPIIQGLYRNVQQNGGRPDLSGFFYTGLDTQVKINGLYDPQLRFMGVSYVQPSVNGIKTLPPGGISVGTMVSTFLGLPVITSKNAVQDTVSRLYLLDTSNPEGFDHSRLEIGILKPTQYFETGFENALLLGKLNNRGMYRTVGELRCRFFAAQGKVRDLK